LGDNLFYKNGINFFYQEGEKGLSDGKVALAGCSYVAFLGFFTGVSACICKYGTCTILLGSHPRRHS
jgi:hypothetical protein